jgi:hypothetical protein
MSTFIAYGLDLPPPPDLRTGLESVYRFERAINALDQAKTPPWFELAHSFFRMIEHAARAYHSATREVKRSHVALGTLLLGSQLRAANHLETFITSMHRATQFLRALEKAGLSLSVASAGSVRTDLSMRVLADLRNATHHLDQRAIRSSCQIRRPREVPETP